MHFFLHRIACTPTLFYFSFCSYFLALVVNKSPYPLRFTFYHPRSTDFWRGSRESVNRLLVSKTERFLDFSKPFHSSISPIGPLNRPKWQISLPFNILKLVKSPPFLIQLFGERLSEGWYGQPKYCYEKTIHVVLIQRCTSLWTSRFWYIYISCFWLVNI